MKIGISMRVDTHQLRAERRDAIDQRLYDLVERLGGHAIPIPNVPRWIPIWLQEVQLDAVILTGGNDLLEVGGDAPERDATEKRVVDWANACTRPIVGICRGMQFIATHAGARLQRSFKHAGVDHHLEGVLAGVVPSHHNWCITDVPSGFEGLAFAEDGSVEAIRRLDRRVLGLMWHPERMSELRRIDLDILAETLKRGADL